MTLIGLLILVIVGALCGAAAQRIVGYRASGFLPSAAIGIVGALLGTWLAGVLGLPSILPLSIEGHPIDVIWAVAGSALLLVLVGISRIGSPRQHHR